MAVSDVLYEAERAIEEYQRQGVITYQGEPEIELVKDVMRAVRMMPGRDRSPSDPNNFGVDLKSALAVYEARKQLQCRADRNTGADRERALRALDVLSGRPPRPLKL